MTNMQLLAREIGKMAILYHREMSMQETQVMSSVWAEALADVTDAEFEKACAAYRKESTRFPFPADILRLVHPDRGEVKDALTLQAMAEWGVVMDAIERLGPYRKPDFHPTTEYVLRSMGGWESACDWAKATMDFKRRDFLELWKTSHGKAHVMELGAFAVGESVRGVEAFGANASRCKDEQGAVAVGAMLHHFAAKAKG